MKLVQVLIIIFIVAVEWVDLLVTPTLSSFQSLLGWSLALFLLFERNARR